MPFFGQVQFRFGQVHFNSDLTSAVDSLCRGLILITGCVSITVTHTLIALHHTLNPKS